jgi:N-acetylgalactosamine PTS system EIIA component
MSEPPVIVAAHGRLAVALVEAVGLISGRAERFIPVSNEGRDASTMLDALREAVDASGATLIVTDLPAGSCTMAARRLQRDRPQLQVVAGMNLPLLLDLALTAESPLAPLALVERSRAHLRAWEGCDVH